MSSTNRPEQSQRTEAERAAYYDAHHAEVVAWPEVPTPAKATAPKQRGVVLSARFTVDAAAAIERAAVASGLSVSAFLRNAAQEAAAAPPAVNHSRIADRLIALAEELSPSKRPTRRSSRGRNTNVGAAGSSSTNVPRDGRTANVTKAQVEKGGLVEENAPAPDGSAAN